MVSKAAAAGGNAGTAYMAVIAFITRATKANGARYIGFNIPIDASDKTAKGLTTTAKPDSVTSVADPTRKHHRPPQGLESRPRASAPPTKSCKSDVTAVRLVAASSQAPTSVKVKLPVGLVINAVGQLFQVSFLYVVKHGFPSRFL